MAGSGSWFLSIISTMLFDNVDAPLHYSFSSGLFWFAKSGAGYQCRSSRVCPDFVLCPEFVLHLSSLCLEYVLIHWMSSLCLQNQTFVLPKSNLCPACPTYVLNLFSDSDQIGQKSEGQNLDKYWIWSITNLQSSHPATGQKVDKLLTSWNQQFVHLLS